MNEELLQPVINGEDLIAPLHTGRSNSIREKLVDMFTPNEWVRVINPDTEAFIWQWLPPHKERIDFDSSTSTVPQKITYRDAPEVYQLDRGQTGVLVGENAYLMIEGLTKKLMSKNAISRRPNIKPGEARNFNFSDDSAQIQWIKEIYLGKANPVAAVRTAKAPPLIWTKLIKTWE